MEALLARAVPDPPWDIVRPSVRVTGLTVVFTLTVVLTAGCGGDQEDASKKRRADTPNSAQTRPAGGSGNERKQEKPTPDDQPTMDCVEVGPAAKKAFADAFPGLAIGRVSAAKAKGELDLPPAPAWKDGAYLVSGEIKGEDRVATLFVSGSWLEEGGGFAAGFGPLANRTNLGADIDVEEAFGIRESDEGFTESLLCAREG